MWDFGRADALDTEAIGEPGQRHFRLRVTSGGDAASLWLEKEQLAALTLAIRQLLEQTEETAPAEDELDSPQGGFPEQPNVDFRLGRLGIGYDESARMVTIFAYEAGEDEDAPPTFSCQVSRSQCRVFADHAEEVISAGRPVCVLCGGPIENGQHQCQRRNGHSGQPISLE
ncbi:MAG: DUF3090 family protein [Dehalococcoidia bacterium]